MLTLKFPNASSKDRIYFKLNPGIFFVRTEQHVVPNYADSTAYSLKAQE